MSTTGTVIQRRDRQVINRCKTSLRLRFPSEPKSHHLNSGLTSMEEKKKKTVDTEDGSGRDVSCRLAGKKKSM